VLSHPAVITPIATTAAPPATAMMRRLMRLEFEVPVRCRELIIIALSGMLTDEISMCRSVYGS
jgi:hypothetical protein